MIYVILFFSFFFSSLYANTYCHHCSGFSVYGKQTLSSLNSEESTRLIETHINGLLRVKGFLYAEKASIHQMEVKGKTNLIECLVTQRSLIEGEFAAIDSRFESPLIITSNQKGLFT